jgi:hypothetical protein
MNIQTRHDFDVTQTKWDRGDLIENIQLLEYLKQKL